MCVDEGVSWLDESSKRAICFYLGSSFWIKGREILHKIEDFATAIEKISGSGAKAVGVYTMEYLHEKVGQFTERNQRQEDLTFAEYIEAARRSFLKKKEAGAYSMREGRIRTQKQAR